MSDGGDKDAFKKITPPFRSAQHLPCKGGKESQRKFHGAVAEMRQSFLDVGENSTVRCGHRTLRSGLMIEQFRRARCPHCAVRSAETIMGAPLG